MYHYNNKKIKELPKYDIPLQTFIDEGCKQQYLIIIYLPSTYLFVQL